jgi:hypothetical protein
MKKKKRRFFNLNINLKIILKKHILRKDINLKKTFRKKKRRKRPGIVSALKGFACGLQFSTKIEEEHREAIDRYLRDNTDMSLSSSTEV